MRVLSENFSGRNSFAHRPFGFFFFFFLPVCLGTRILQASSVSHVRVETYPGLVAREFRGCKQNRCSLGHIAWKAIRVCRSSSSCPFSFLQTRALSFFLCLTD